MSEPKFSEQGDKARKALHDMRWGPYIEDVVERQENMDAAIKIALQVITTFEQQVKELKGELLHCEAFDETAFDFENGEELVWGALTKGQKDYWIALAAKE